MQSYRLNRRFVTAPRRSPCLSFHISETIQATHRNARLDLSTASTLIPSIPAISLSSDETVGRKTNERKAFDDQYIWGLIQLEWLPLLTAGCCLVLCTASNLAAPVLSGAFLEALVQQKPIEEIRTILFTMAISYAIEPLLTKVYIEKGLGAGEKILATLRCELFRILLM